MIAGPPQNSPQNHDFEVKRLKAELDVLIQISVLTTEVSDVDYLLTRCLEIVCSSQKWLAGQIWFIEDEQLVCSPDSHAAFVDISDHRESSLSKPIVRGEGTVGLAWDTEAAVWSGTVTSSGTAECSEIFAFPLRKGRNVIGVCEFLTGSNRPLPANTYFFERLGSYLGQVLMQKDTEKNLHLAELKYRQIINKAYDGFVSLDRNGVIVDWNIQCEKMFGWFKQDVLGKPMLDVLLPASQRHAYGAELSHFLETGSSTLFKQRVELSVLHHDGHQFPIEIALFPVSYSDNLVFGAFLQDVTAKKEQAEKEKKWIEELVSARDEAIKLSTMKSEFVANISHEIRTPMSGILGLAEILLDETEGDARETAAYLYKSAKRLMSLVSDLLDLSKIEAGGAESSAGLLRVDEIVENSCAEFSAVAAKKGLDLAYDVEHSLRCDLHGDAELIAQVLKILIQNAIKFTETGAVKLAVRPQKNYEGSVFVRFSVTDTGCGISTENQNRLFQPFVQADSSTTRKHEGAGLGLVLAKQLIVLMGGAIGVDSIADEGSSFWFVIPLKMV